MTSWLRLNLNPLFSSGFQLFSHLDATEYSSIVWNCLVSSVVSISTTAANATLTELCQTQTYIGLWHFALLLQSKRPQRALAEEPYSETVGSIDLHSKEPQSIVPSVRVGDAAGPIRPFAIVVISSSSSSLDLLSRQMCHTEAYYIFYSLAKVVSEVCNGNQLKSLFSAYEL